MAEEQVIQSLLDTGWESVHLSYQDGKYTISVCLDEWVTDDLYQSRALPTGKGKTLDDALAALKQDIAVGP